MSGGASNPYWRCEPDEASHREDARRCQSCDYSLAGLPERGDETQCPECGHIGPPGDGSAPSLAGRRVAALTVAGLISMLNGFVVMVFLSMAWGRAGHSDDAVVDFSIAVLLLYVAVAVWFVPRGRFPFSRWASACAAGGLAVWGVSSMPSWDIVLVLLVAYDALVVAFLIHPEVTRWLRVGKGDEA